MKQVRPFLALSVLLLATACNRQESAPTQPAQQGQATATPAEAPASAATPELDSAGFIELPLDGSTTLPHTLTAGQALSGEFAAPRAGEVTSIQVMVGNYDNSSSGTLALKLCQGGNCAEGTADLATSKNNDFLPIALVQPLALSADATPVSYVLTRASGDNLFAIWVYSSSVPTSKILTEDGKAAPLTAKIRLGYNR